MKCSEFERLEMKYLDGNISDGEYAAMCEHMDLCDKCKRDFELYTRLNEGFAELDEPMVPDSFTADVMLKVEALPARSGRLVFLVFCSVIAAVSSVVGFLNLVVINSPVIVDKFVNGGVPYPLVAAVEFTAAVGNAFYGILLKTLEFTYNPGILVFVLIGLGLYTAFKKSVGGVRR